MPRSLFLPASAFFFSILAGSALKGQSAQEMLQMSLDELMKVEIVSAGKRPQSLDEIPASAVVITREELMRYGYRTLGEALEQAPGLFGIDDWFALGMHLGVRGFWDAYNRNIVFLIDNVKQSEFLFGGSHFTAMNVPIEAIERIEIVRGPMSLFYGTGAFFGVINVITHKATDGKRRLSWVLGMGGEGTKKASVKAMGQEGRLSLSATAGLYRTDGRDVDYALLGDHLRPGSTGRLLSEENRYFHLSGELGGFYADISYNETSSGKNIFTQPDADYDGQTWIRQVRCAMGYNHAFSSAFETQVGIQYGFFNNEMDYDFGLLDDAWEWEQYNARILEIDANAIWRPRSNLQVAMGFNGTAAYDLRMMTDAPLFGFNRSMTYTGDDAIVTEAAYAQLHWTLSPTFNLVAGFRLDRRDPFTLRYLNNAHMQYIDPDTVLGLVQYENSRRHPQGKIDFIPQAALIWRPSERHLVKFLYGEANNRSNFFMLYNMVRDLESPQLTNEHIRTWEINTLSMIHRSVSLGLGLYRNELRDLIVRSAGFDSNGAYYTFHDNLGHMVTWGSELQFQTAFASGWGLDISATYQRTRDRVHPDEEVAYSPKHIGTVKGYWDVSRRFSVALTAHYVGAMASQYDDSLKNPNDPGQGVVGRIGPRVDGRLLVGGNIRFHGLFHEKVFVNLRVTNLTNADIYYPVAFYSTWTEKGTLGPGRTWLLTVGWDG